MSKLWLVRLGYGSLGWSSLGICGVFNGCSIFFWPWNIYRWVFVIPSKNISDTVAWSWTGDKLPRQLLCYTTLYGRWVTETFHVMNRSIFSFYETWGILSDSDWIPVLDFEVSLGSLINTGHIFRFRRCNMKTFMVFLVLDAEILSNVCIECKMLFQWSAYCVRYVKAYIISYGINL